MKFKFVFSLLLLFVTLPLQAQNSPCYWQGQLVKCYPTTGIFLDKQRSLRLGDSGSTNYVELKGGSSITTYSLTMPTAQGAASTFLQNNGSGVLSWVTNTGATVPSAGGIVYSNGTSLLSAAGTSGGIPYFSASNVPSSSGVLGANEVVVGGGAGASPTTPAAVGVNTTSPSSKSIGSTTILDVSGSAGNGGNVTMHNTSNATAELSLFAGNNGFFIDYTGQTTAANNQLQFRTNNSSASNTVGNVSLTLASTGKNTIGPSAGGVAHDVNGSLNLNTTEAQPTNGIYRSTTNEIAIATNTTEKAVVAADGALIFAGSHFNGSTYAQEAIVAGSVGIYTVTAASGTTACNDLCLGALNTTSTLSSTSSPGDSSHSSGLCLSVWNATGGTGSVPVRVSTNNTSDCANTGTFQRICYCAGVKK